MDKQELDGRLRAISREIDPGRRAEMWDLLDAAVLIIDDPAPERETPPQTRAAAQQWWDTSSEGTRCT